MEQVIQRINVDDNIIVICDTREMCHKIKQEINNINPNNATVNVIEARLTLPIIKEMLKNTQIIISTPGLIYDLIDRNYIKIFRIKSYIVKNREAIEYRGFARHLNDILPQNIQVLDI
jgi:superfamily II DNA/RNA helicase